VGLFGTRNFWVRSRSGAIHLTKVTTPTNVDVVGRYAPSPSGDLHVGNLRTALLAWLSARSQNGQLMLRIDDLDPFVSSVEAEQRQLADIARLELSFSGSPLRQSTRFEVYHEAIRQLIAGGFVYPCFCSRREVREAAVAPHEHLPEGAYPGTCAVLSTEQRSQRSAHRPAALRVRANLVEIQVHDRLYGTVTETVDDFVVRRNDGVPSYNLATVLDDEAQGVTEVVRGADLLSGTARHVWLRTVLDLRPVEHAHVPLMMNANGERLAKRDGAVTLADLEHHGLTPLEVRSLLAESVGLCSAGAQPSMPELLQRYDPALLPKENTTWDPGFDAQD